MNNFKNKANYFQSKWLYIESNFSSVMHEDKIFLADCNLNNLL